MLMTRALADIFGDIRTKNEKKKEKGKREFERKILGDGR